MQPNHLKPLVLVIIVSLIFGHVELLPIPCKLTIFSLECIKLMNEKPSSKLYPNPCDQDKTAYEYGEDEENQLIIMTNSSEWVHNDETSNNSVNKYGY